MAASVAITYLLSLPFFLFFPVPERWSYPESHAVLLSDRLSPALMEIVRPVSGIDNCFPSFHVSLTTVLIVVCYACAVRMRRTVLVLGVIITLSTFVLGIHWLADIVAGAAVGIVCVAIAHRILLRGHQAVARVPG